MISTAAFRERPHEELQKLAEEHIEHDLTPSDRDILKSAVNKISAIATVGSLLGMGLGLAAAWKIRSNRVKFFEAFKAKQKPTHIRFADGREEAVPDITPLLEPSRWGDITTYSLFGLAGYLVWGQAGILGGIWLGNNTISRDPELKLRVENAYRNYRLDILKKEIEALERGKPRPDLGILVS